ncbi:MAG: NAD-dependent epimerase/dehydratase family protein [Spartobacteria bacterium]|nr:NAD-dependent epimerase/dehydratase family protein [Spartobacteria bacterium]
MRVLVTGANGFAGRHLMEELLRAGYAPYAFDQVPVEGMPRDRSFTGDLRHPDDLHTLIRAVKPDACVHLGGIAFVPAGWTDPQRVFSVNLIGSINLLEALRKESPQTRTLLVSSAEIYGREPGDSPFTEDTPPAPANPYAASKLGADLTALLYAKRYDMPVMTARPANHIGPGQSESFVAASFARQLAHIALQKSPPVMRVGNLDCQRDFTDVRDIACAYRLIIENGHPGMAYNISSEIPVSIRAILEQLCQAANVDPAIEVDPDRWRPADAMPHLSARRLRDHTGWTPRIALAQTLQDIYQDTIQQLAGEK